MPGLIENACTTSYAYVDPYVQKTRNAVPLFDRAAQRLEERVPPLIKQVDQFAEPTIEKLRPKVEPIYNKGIEKAGETIEKLRPKVEPIYNKGVEKAGELKGLAMPYYEGGAHRIDKAKELATPYYEGGAKHVKEIRADCQQICRVAASANLQDLKTVSKINKLLGDKLTQIETLMDRYLPAPPNDADAQSDDSSASDNSALLARMLILPIMLINRLVYKSKLYIPKKEDLTLVNLKAKVPIVRDQVNVKFTMLWAKVKPFIEQKYEALSQTRLFKHVSAKVAPALAKLKAKVPTIREQVKAKVALTLANLKDKLPIVRKQVNVKVAVIWAKAKPFVEPKVAMIWAKAKPFVEPKLAMIWAKAKPFVEQKYEALTQTDIFKAFIAAAVSTAKRAKVGCEKVLGKEKMQACLAKVEGSAPASWKAALAKMAQSQDNQKKEVPQKENSQTEVPRKEIPQKEIPQTEVPRKEIPQKEIPQKREKKMQNRDF